jgi:hypothetical protein
VICRTRDDEIEELTSTARWWLWSFIALFAIAVLGLRQWQISKRAADQQAWIARCTQIDVLSKKTHLMVQSLWNTNLGPKRMKRTTLEQAINGGKPFVSTKSQGASDNVKWIDPVSGRAFEFDFFENEWIGWGSQGGSFLYPPPPTASTLENNLEYVRGAIAGWNSGYGPLFWILLLIMTLALRRWRPVMAEGLLALAVVCTVAWAVHPGSSLNWRGITSNDMLFWGCVMLIISSFAIVRTREKRTKPLLPICPKCRYNLTGNISGVCPECGHAIPMELTQRFGVGNAISQVG